MAAGSNPVSSAEGDSPAMARGSIIAPRRHAQPPSRLIRQPVPTGIDRLREPQELLQLLPIKSHHRLAVDEGYRRCPKSQLNQLLKRRLIRSDVLDDVCDALLRKKLLLSVARASPGLGVDDHLLRHRTLLRSCRCPGDLRLGVPSNPVALYEIGPVRSTKASSVAYSNRTDTSTDTKLSPT